MGRADKRALLKGAPMIRKSSAANLVIWTVTCPVCGMRSEKFSAAEANRAETEHGALHRKEES